ncbi:MAG TPA: STAS domain-containing protein [Terriglobales bacterium]|nr:STAS domain-containing protein [Terriglobales bacterium]
MPTHLKKQGTTAILELQGKLALGDNLDEFRTKWSEAIATGVRDVVVNLEKVPMVDSSGIGSLIRCHSAVTAIGGKLKLVSAGEMVRQSFRIMRLDRVFEFYDNEASALASITAAV